MTTCPNCGAEVDVPDEGAQPIRETNGAGSAWVIRAGGEEIHRCEEDDPAHTLTS